MSYFDWRSGSERGDVMKRRNVDATDKNVLESIKNNTLGRNIDVKETIELLERIEGNFFISLDAKWGNGKTFFVRQTEKTLEYLTKREWAMNEAEKTQAENLKKIFEKTDLESLNIKQSYLPIYYNAWLYDNHNDPLLSLVYAISKLIDVNTKLPQDKKSTILNLLSTLTVAVNLGKTPVSVGVNPNIHSGSKDILDEIKTSEEIRTIVKNVLDEVITERAQRLVILLDELDRCRPDYAIQTLERIKHYFDDDRIIIIASINKEQLVHTVRNVYGEYFDASGYLNRFFDLSLHLPNRSIDTYLKQLHLQNYSTNMLTQVSNELKEQYNLSIRESVLYSSKIQAIEENSSDNYGNGEWAFLSVLIPCIALLEIRNVGEKLKVLEGDGSDIIKRIIENSEKAKKAIVYLVEESQVTDDTYNRGWEEFARIYKFSFKGSERYGFYPGKMEIRKNIAEICIRLFNEGYV